MPFIIQYFLKLSIYLALVYLFYQLVLRKLTFYTANRWYLIAYSFLSFFIPFINITPLLQKNDLAANGVVKLIPSFDVYTTAFANGVNYPARPISWDKWDWMMLVAVCGICIFLLVFFIRLVSFTSMRRKAKLLSDDGMKLYQVDKEIIPFSFGNSIFINPNLHSEYELTEIIRHEFVHIKQRHTADILWCEVLCILNWYNPFVWLIRQAIRQNLEFIADDKVLENGINKKQYQYLLLKVIGNNPFSIASKFNFSSLKKRIAMMNKMKSARRQLLRLLFLLPATAILLLAFRNKWNDPGKNNQDKKVSIAGLVVDAKTMKPLANVNIFCREKNIGVQTDEKGYYLLQLPFENKPLQFSLEISKEGFVPLHQKENWGNFYIDKIHTLYGNTFEFFGLGTEGSQGFSAITGNAKTTEGLQYDEVTKKFENLSLNLTNRETGDIDSIPLTNSKGYYFDIEGNKSNSMVIVKDKNGKVIERVLLSKWKENQERYENLYGELVPPPPPPPPPPVPPVPPLPPLPPTPSKDTDIEISVVSDANVVEMPGYFEISGNKVVINLKNGKAEVYDLTDPAQRKKLVDKYGDIMDKYSNTKSIATNVKTSIYTIPATAGPTTLSTDVRVTPEVSIRSNVTRIPAQAITTTINGTTITSPALGITPALNGLVTSVDDNVGVLYDEPELVITITRRTTAAQLEEYKKQMKEKGIELKFDNSNYDKGILTRVSGTVKFKNGNGSFSGSDFEKLILAIYKEGDDFYFRARTIDKEVI